MAKKKKSTTKKAKEEKAINAIGTPTAILLPARNYKFKVFTETHVLKVPRSGTYMELNGELFTEKDGDFDFLHYSEKDNSYTISIPALSKVLFATGQYPDMKDAEAFTPVAITIKDDEVEILGNLIEMVREK